MKIIKVITVIAIHEYHLNYYMKIIFTRLILERTICGKNNLFFFCIDFRIFLLYNYDRLEGV